MATPGRKPKPSHLKVVDGNPGKRPINKKEPKPKPIEPTMPAHLDATARKEWRRIGPILERLGLLTEIDGTALACYCMAYSRWTQAEKTIQEWRKKWPGMGLCFKTPNGSLQQIPQVGIANQAIREIRAWCAEFGMTPSARSRMTITPEEDGDDMENLLSGR